MPSYDALAAKYCAAFALLDGALLPPFAFPMPSRAVRAHKCLNTFYWTFSTSMFTTQSAWNVTWRADSRASTVHCQPEPIPAHVRSKRKHTEVAAR